MNLLIDRRRAADRPARTRAARPRVEGLEDRLLMFATSGAEWTYGSRITYSFVPDGTSVGGPTSTFFSTLNGYYSTATWEAAFQKAAALWEGVAHISLVQVPDDGSAIGAENYQQGAPDMGDIRIGATSQPSGQLAFAFMPPPLNGGSAAGDIFINNTTNWGTNGYDLETVAIHEFGHALGLYHSAITSADMYAYYNGQKQTLNSDDISGIQAIYGTQSDTATDKTMATATPITLNGNDQATVTNLNLSGPTDTNWFSVVVPSTTSGTLTIQMQTTNLSSLEPRVTLYNSTGGGLSLVTAATLGGGTATLTYSGVTAGQTYYIRASSGVNSTIGAAGAYALLVNLGTGTQAPAAPPNTTIAAVANQGGGSQSDTTTGAPTSNHHHGHAGHKATHTGPQETVTVGGITGIGDALTARLGALRHGRHR